jgi:hypothetical protein
MAELNGGEVDIHMSHDGSFVYVLVCPNTKINEAESDTRRKGKGRNNRNTFKRTGSSQPMQLGGCQSDMSNSTNSEFSRISMSSW